MHASLLQRCGFTAAVFVGLISGLLAQPVETADKNKDVPTSAEILDIIHVTTKPVPTHREKPVYPFNLRRRNVTGSATIAFVVTKEGKVVNATVVKADHEDFGRAAQAAVSKWKFRPAQINGLPVNCRMMVPIMFNLGKR